MTYSEGEITEGVDIKGCVTEPAITRVTWSLIVRGNPGTMVNTHPTETSHLKGEGAGMFICQLLSVIFWEWLGVRVGVNSPLSGRLCKRAKWHSIGGEEISRQRNADIGRKSNCFFSIHLVHWQEEYGSAPRWPRSYIVKLFYSNAQHSIWDIIVPHNYGHTNLKSEWLWEILPDTNEILINKRTWKERRTREAKQTLGAISTHTFS